MKKYVIAVVATIATLFLLAQTGLLAPFGIKQLSFTRENGDKDAVRFDFFPLSKGNENYIREVRKVGDEEVTTIYKATFKDQDDDDDDVKTAGGIMLAWAEAIANAK